MLSTLGGHCPGRLPGLRRRAGKRALGRGAAQRRRRVVPFEPRDAAGSATSAGRTPPPSRRDLASASALPCSTPTAWPWDDCRVPWPRIGRAEPFAPPRYRDPEPAGGRRSQLPPPSAGGFRGDAAVPRRPGTGRRKTCVLYNGVDLERFRPRPPTGYLHRQLGLAPDVPLIGTIGQISLRKGHDVLAAALANLSASRPAAEGRVGDSSHSRESPGARAFCLADHRPAVLRQGGVAAVRRPTSSGCRRAAGRKGPLSRCPRRRRIAFSTS